VNCLVGELAVGELGVGELAVGEQTRTRIIYIDCAKVSYIKTIGGVDFSLIILVIKNLYLLDCEK
jgi:hypothetical protein